MKMERQNVLKKKNDEKKLTTEDYNEEKAEGVLKREEEKENHSFLLKKKSFRIALISIFTALSVVIGYLLVSIPNIELFTLMLFLSGFILGKKNGAIIGLMSSFLFTFFNPFGSSATFAPLFAYQLFHYTAIGLLGGAIKDFLKDKNYFTPHEDLYDKKIMVLFGIIGAILTTIYDLITTLIGAIFIYGSIQFFVWYYLSGVVFTTIHLVGNTLGFIFILPGLISLIYKWFE
ncbi:MAG: conserved membrane protein of unknown function [Promethearchaeota archaeon]|nr:MAG: conserved membrane protein of unknown function [Candidatus Lokiarchaeota archaeon]